METGEELRQMERTGNGCARNNKGNSDTQTDTALSKGGKYFA